MAKPARTKRPAKLSRAEKKAVRATKREQRRETWRSIRQTFQVSRENDRRMLPLMIMYGVVAAAVVYVLFYWWTGSPWYPIAVAVIIGLFAALIVFNRRAQRAMFTQAEGQPGAAGWLLQNQLRGDWRVTQAVAGTTQLDVVHRLIGRPGIVLVGEGAQHRVRGLVAQEKKKVARVAGETPIYDVIVGTGEGDLRLAKLRTYLLKLPSNLSKDQVNALEKRLAALGTPRPPLPQGPMPQGAKMRNLQRTVRRRS
jgi:hypothetical protein